MSSHSAVTAVVNATFFTGDSVIPSRSLLFDDSGIVGWAGKYGLPPDAIVIDAGGALVAPGLIDLQVNGAGTHNCSTFTTAADIQALGTELARTGTTRWAPTILSRPVTVSTEIAGLAAPVAEDAGVIALHLEGPWLSADKPGAHTVSRLCAPTDDDIAAVLRIADTMPTIVTIAPEVVPDALLDQLTQHPNTRVMLSHSTADFDATARFFDRGGAGITHVLNTMHGIAARAPGPIPAFIANRGKYASVIADGVHVHAATLRMLKRAADPDALFLVSDLIWDEFHEQSRILAGSTSSLLDAVQFCVGSVGIALEEALRMATLYPARLLGVDARYGKIVPGYVADLVGFDSQFNVSLVVRNGRFLCGGP